MVAALAIPMYHRVTTPQVADADYNQFGLRAVAPPSQPVAEDRWVVTNEGVRVSETLFPGEPWGASVLREQRLIGRWHPRYGSTNADTAGQFVNVVNGQRETLSIDDPEATVWLFGGSTVYGIGQRDHHTIASHLVREAAREGRRLRVVNYGASGYVNWQETKVFADELQAGPAPDVAVFLDGANEVTLAFEREVYGLLDASQPLALTADQAVRRERLADAQARGWEEDHDPRRQERLAAEQYAAGVRRARSLGVRYGVPMVHLWQPMLATMPTDRPGVATAYNNLDLDLSWGGQQEVMIDAVADRSGVDPIDLTDLFDEVDQPVFFDWAHCNEFGAGVQASAIWDHLEPIIVGTDDRQGVPQHP